MYVCVCVCVCVCLGGRRVSVPSISGNPDLIHFNEKNPIDIHLSGKPRTSFQFVMQNLREKFMNKIGIH